MRRFYSLILCAAFAVNIAGCTATQPEQTDKDLFVIGFSQVGSESDWRIANTQSMIDTFTEDKGYELRVVNARQNQDNQFAAVRNFILEGVDFIVIAPTVEEGWDSVLAEVKAAGIPVGAYWYSYARTVDEARQEAETCISILRSKQFEYPIFFDVEEKATLNTGKANCSAMIRAFCEVLEKAGYWVGLYTSRSVLGTHIEDDINTRYALWAAEWGAGLNYSGSVGIWQYSDKGKVDGINGYVDLDEGYVDYARIVKEKGLNGFAASTPAADAPANEQKSAAVILQIGDDIYKGTLTKA